MLLGLVGAWGLLMGGGFAFHTARGAVGTSWFHYREAAHIMMHPDELWASWPMWRNNLYPWLLGWMGERWGFSQASSWISSAATLGIAVGAGLGARALATPMIGAVTMVVTVSIPLVGSGVHQMDVHPTLGAAFALTTGLGLCAVRWRRWPWVVATGMVAGLAQGLDGRGSLALVMGVGLVLIAGWGRGWRQLLLCGLLFSSLAWVGPGLEMGLRSDSQRGLTQAGEQAHLFGQLHLQAVHTDGDIAEIVDQQPGHPLGAACEGGVPRSVGDALAIGPCTRAIWAHNTRGLQKRHSLPPPWLLLFLPVAMLPARWGRRSMPAAVLAIGLPVGAIGTMVAMVVVGDRYLAPFAAAMAMVGPVAVHRVLSICAPRLASVSAIGALALWCLVWPTWPTAADMHPGPSAVGWRAVPWLEAHMDRGDTLVDCSGESLELHFLPWQVRGSLSPNDQRIMPGASCAGYILGPVTGTQWLILQQGRRIRVPGWSDQGWAQVQVLDGLLIYRRKPSG